MKDRWLTLLLAVGAFAAFFRFFVGPVAMEADEHSRPLSTETRANGYFAMRRWLESEQLQVTELRRRYDWLLRAPGMPATGNLLITTLPHKRHARPSEMSVLSEWVARGNAVVVVAGLFDTPEWGIPDTDTPGTIRRFSKIGIRDHEREKQPAQGQPEAPPVPVFARLSKPKRSVMKPVAEHPLMQGVRAVHALSEYPAGTFDVNTPRHEAVLTLMTDADSGLGAFWLTWIGDGAVIVSGYGSVFTNKLLAQADNAALAANIVAAHVSPGGHVIFDDVHQGAASFYDAEAFFGDPRLHASFWWVIGLWLLWVLGSTRLPPPPAHPAPVREQAFVDATGNFLARVAGRRRAAERMFSGFFNDLRRALGEAPDGRPLWAWMRASGAVQPADVDRLQALHARVAAGKRVDLVVLHNQLQQLRKQLA